MRGFGTPRTIGNDLDCPRFSTAFGAQTESDAYWGQLVERRSISSLCRRAGSTSSSSPILAAGCRQHRARCARARTPEASAAGGDDFSLSSSKWPRPISKLPRRLPAARHIVRLPRATVPACLVTSARSDAGARDNCASVRGVEPGRSLGPGEFRRSVSAASGRG